MRTATVQIFGPSSGTQTASLGSWGQSHRIVAIEAAGFSYSLTSVRSKPTLRERSPTPRSEVSESLERSLTEHGEIWAELAKR